MSQSLTQRTYTSIAILLGSLGLAYVPLPGLLQTVTVVSGTELKEPLEALEQQFEQAHPNIQLELKFQGSQDIANNYLNQTNDFTPTVLIPANGEILKQLSDRWQAQNNSKPFHNEPQAIAKTMLVGIAWPERGKVLFPSGRFEWERVEQAMRQRNWGKMGGQADWGSFDFVITDPTRSNSGQLTLSLLTETTTGNKALNSNSFNTPSVQSLFTLVRQSVYLPPRSTDILLQEFITRGPNDADVATVYESIALYRWSEAKTTKGKPYQIYYLDPTIETVATAAIARQDVGGLTAGAAEKFITFLREPAQQEVFIRFGFRPVADQVDLAAAPNSPWAENIPGAQVETPSQTLSVPTPTIIDEILRSWQRAQ